MSKYKNVVKGNSTQKKIKVVAYCDSPTCATGFATVSRNILDGLHNTGRFDIDIIAINYWGDPHNFPYRIWPAGTNSDKDPYGRKKAFSMIQQMDFDILFFLQDTFILEFLPELHNSLRAKGKKFRSICYFPIDGTPKVPWIHNVNACDHLIAYSDFGKRESMGVLPIMKEPMVIPHGVNTKEYFPVDKKEVEAFRSHFFGAQANKFIFTNVNRNQQRKDIPRTIVAFSEFHKQAPDSILYLHCFSEGTEIRVFNGIKNIEDITKGDVVLTKNGVFKEVYETSCRELKEEESIMEVCVTGRNNSILATSDHRFMAIKPMTTLCAHDECLPMCKNRWIYRKENWISNCDRSISENYIPEWVETKDLKEGDYLLIPIPKNNIGKVPDDLYISDVFNLASINYIEDGIFIKTSNHPRTISIPNKLNITKELMKLFGYYLSEGCVRGTMDTVQFTFNIKEVKYVDFVVSNIKNIFGLTTIVRHFPEKNTTQLTVCSSTLAKFFKSLFGHSAHTKKYPEWFNFLSDDKFFGLITGMFDGDGHYTDRFIAYSSVSLDLITLVRDGLLRRKFFMSIRDTYRPDGSSFNGFMATIHSDLERLYLNLEIDDFKLTKVNKEYYHFFIDGYVACRIHSIKPSDYTGSVYNMSVVDDESYCVNGGFIAHNCAKKDQGWDLPEIVKSYGLSTVNDVIFPENFGPNQGYPRNIVNLIYNASDCVISTTLGEGFGFCLHPETNIYTDSGIKCIKDLTVMDKVLSSNGTYNEVQAIMSKYHDDSLYNITTWMSNIPIKSSPEHGFLTLDNGNYTWKKAENLLVGDQLLFPRNCDKNYDLNIDNESAKINDDYLILPIKKIKVEKYCGKLIDIQVANTNDFIAENVVVHNSWIESMATKTPVIMPGNTMMPEFITEDRGWLVKSGSNPSLFTVVPNDNEVVRPLVDVEDMIRIMKEVYSNSEEVKKRTENAYSWATTQMDWSSHIVPKWLTIFDSAYKSLMTGEVVKSETNNVIATESF